MGNEMEMARLMADLIFGDMAQDITDLLPTTKVIAILVLVVSAILLVVGTIVIRRAVRGAQKTLNNERRGTYRKM